MGVLCGQALQGFFSPYGQIQDLPGIGARHFFRLQQGSECSPIMISTEKKNFIHKDLGLMIFFFFFILGVGYFVFLCCHERCWMSGRKVGLRPLAFLREIILLSLFFMIFTHFVVPQIDKM